MLARRSDVSVDAIERFENVSGSLKCTEIQAIQDTLEKLGAVFIPENGSGYGVRLKFNNQEAAEIALSHRVIALRCGILVASEA